MSGDRHTPGPRCRVPGGNPDEKLLSGAIAVWLYFLGHWFHWLQRHWDCSGFCHLVFTGSRSPPHEEHTLAVTVVFNMGKLLEKEKINWC